MQAFILLSVQGSGNMLRCGFKVGLHMLPQGVTRPGLTDDACAGMEACNILRQHIHPARIESILLHLLDEQMVELSHFQAVIHDICCNADAKSCLPAADWQYFKIESGGKASVQFQFTKAEMLSFGQRGKIKKAEIKRFLDFIGIGSGQNNPGNMRFQQTDIRCRMGVGGRVKQSPDMFRQDHGRMLFGRLQKTAPGQMVSRISLCEFNEHAPVNITDADHAHQFIIFHNGNSTQILQAHVGGGFQHRHIRIDSHRIGCHDFAYLHA